MINKLGEYLYYRIMNDQERLARSKPRNLQGLYIGKRDIQSYVWDYFNLGMDETRAPSREEPLGSEEPYWDDRDESDFGIG